MRARSIGPADSDPIATACSVRGAASFHRALGVVVDQYRHVPIGAQLPELRALQVLSLFLLDVQFWAKERSGMSRFLLDPQHKLGVLAPEAARFCEAIGAKRTAQHFTRTFAQFPGGVLPSDYTGIVRSLAPMLSARPNPLVVIEREHTDTFSELTAALRRWLRANREHVASAIAASLQQPARSQSGSTESSPLAEILTRGGPPGSETEYDVLDELAEWVWSTPGRRGLPFREIPDGAQMIVLMESVARALGSGGVRYVADWSVFDDFAALRRHAETIGAHVTAQWLDELAALFPRKRIPDDRDARVEALDRREAKDAKKGLHPIEALDERYAEAVRAELPRCVRDHVRFNRARFEQEATSAAAQPPGSSADDLLLDTRDWIAFNQMMLAKYGPDARTDELPEEERAMPGDVMEVKAGRRFAYYQVTHRHRFWGMKGPLMRAIAGTLPARLEGDALAAHVAGSTQFVALVAIDRARGERKAKLVARGLPVPPDCREFPRMLFHWGKTRDGRNVWGEWDGGTTAIAQHVGPLPSAFLRMPVAQGGPDYEMLGEAVRDGWTPMQHYANYGERGVTN